MRFYTTDQLSPNQHLTPEGFLVCKDVAIGRTGDMLYAAGEVPVAAGADGTIRISRDAEAVFHDDTIASFQGKPVTMDHPAKDVNPQNWGLLAKGIVQHVRRGAGTSDNLLLADLLVTDQAAIEAVRRGLRQVSCGYDAVYDQIEPGRGRQRNIIGNHVALVEKGRCGERCAIGDRDMPATAQKKTRWTDWKALMATAFKTRDEGEMNSLLAEAPEPDDPSKGAANEENTTANGGNATNGLETKIDAMMARLEALEARMRSGGTGDKKSADDETEEEKKKRKEKEDEDDDEDEKKKSSKSGDAAMPTRDEMQDVFARAEILSPGVRLPTFDSAAKPATVRDSLCALRRLALTRYSDSDNGRVAIVPFVGKTPDFAKMTCDAVANVFVAASEIAKRENNIAATMSHDAVEKARRTANTITEINRRNHEIWDNRK